MIALVSSTIFPPDLEVHGGTRTWLTGEQRLQQTRATVASLVAVGAREIVVADNSAERWLAGSEADLWPARVLRLSTPQFRNKGISELFLLRSALPVLPDGEPILKLSGRYRLTRDPSQELSGEDVVGRVERRRRQWLLSTRCYAVRDRATYARLLDLGLRELYAQATRIVGPRSLLRIIRNSLQPDGDEYPYDDPPVSIESVFGVLMRRGRFRFRALERLGVEGVLGHPTATPISE